MLVIGIICLIMAAISYLRFFSFNKQENKTNEAKWQRSLAIIFLVLGLILVVYALVLHKF